MSKPTVISTVFTVIRWICILLELYIMGFFRDGDIGVRCEGQCEFQYIDCTQSCSDTNCLVECGRTLNDCINGLSFCQILSSYIIFLDCPCNLNCPNGCNDCPNSICVCGENPSPQNEDNLEQCKNERSIYLGQCIIDCKDDQSCEQSCVSFFKMQYDQCPCQVKNPKSLISTFYKMLSFQGGLSVWMPVWLIWLPTWQEISLSTEYLQLK